MNANQNIETENCISVKGYWGNIVTKSYLKMHYLEYLQALPDYFIFLYEKYREKQLLKWGLTPEQIENLSLAVHSQGNTGFHHEQLRVFSGGNNYRNIVLMDKLDEKIIHYIMRKINPHLAHMSIGEWLPMVYFDFKIPVFIKGPDETLKLSKKAIESFLNANDQIMAPPSKEALMYLFRRGEIEKDFFERMNELLETPNDRWRLLQKQIEKFMQNPKKFPFHFFIPRPILVQTCQEFGVGNHHFKTIKNAMRNFLLHGETPREIQKEWLARSHKNEKSNEPTSLVENGALNNNSPKKHSSNHVFPSKHDHPISDDSELSHVFVNGRTVKIYQNGRPSFKYKRNNSGNHRKS